MLELLAQATQPVVTGLDVVEKVSTFFYFAWGMVVVLLVFVGGLIPWWAGGVVG